MERYLRALTTEDGGLAFPLKRGVLPEPVLGLEPPSSPSGGRRREEGLRISGCDLGNGDLLKEPQRTSHPSPHMGPLPAPHAPWTPAPTLTTHVLPTAATRGRQCPCFRYPRHPQLSGLPGEGPTSSLPGPPNTHLNCTSQDSPHPSLLASPRRCPSVPPSLRIKFKALFY